MPSRQSPRMVTSVPSAVAPDTSCAPPASFGVSGATLSLPSDGSPQASFAGAPPAVRRWSSSRSTEPLGPRASSAHEIAGAMTGTLARALFRSGKVENPLSSPFSPNVAQTAAFGRTRTSRRPWPIRMRARKRTWSMERPIDVTPLKSKMISVVPASSADTICCSARSAADKSHLPFSVRTSVRSPTVSDEKEAVWAVARPPWAL
jgi:hypothetical protein